MVNLSSYPISVDGVRLDTHAIGVEASQQTLGGLRSADQVLAGLDGEVPALHDSREPGWYELSMLVKGTNEDGLVPVGQAAQATYQENLNVLRHLLCQQGSLRTVRRVVNPATSPASDVVATAKVEDSVSPTDYPGDYGRLSARFKLVEGYWRSVDAATTSTVVTTNVPVTIAALTGSTAPVEDAVAALTGPAGAGVQIVDDATGFGVTLTEALPAGSVWRVNSATWESRVGVGLTVGSADTAGTNKDGVTNWSGTYPRYLRLHPRTVAGSRVVRARVIGTGFTAATALAVKGRKAYL